jgi:hypothetical protein
LPAREACADKTLVIATHRLALLTWSTVIWLEGGKFGPTGPGRCCDAHPRNGKRGSGSRSGRSASLNAMACGRLVRHGRTSSKECTGRGIRRWRGQSLPAFVDVLTNVIMVVMFPLVIMSAAVRNCRSGDPQLRSR